VRFARTFGPVDGGRHVEKETGSRKSEEFARVFPRYAEALAVSWIPW